jgi:hypothetical protein
MSASTEGRDFSFSLLVHADTSSPMIDFQPSSSMLQVRADCPVEQLIEFMSSEVSGVWWMQVQLESQGGSALTRLRGSARLAGGPASDGGAARTCRHTCRAASLGPPAMPQ